MAATTRKPSEVAKKTSAKKAPAKTALAAPPGLPATPDPRMLTFYGRQVLVRKPTAEQLVDFEDSFDGASAAESLAETRIFFAAFYASIESFMVNEEDREWLREGRRTGQVSLEHTETQNFLPAVLDLFADYFEAAGNRATRRAARKRA